MTDDARTEKSPFDSPYRRHRRHCILSIPGDQCPLRFSAAGQCGDVGATSRILRPLPPVAMLDSLPLIAVCAAQLHQETSLHSEALWGLWVVVFATVMCSQEGQMTGR